MFQHNRNHTCPGQEETVQRFLDNNLSPGERAEFAAHTRHCPACRTLLVEFQTLFTTLDSLEDIAVPVDIVEQVMGRLPAARPQWHWRAWHTWLLAGQIMVGLGLLWVLTPLPDHLYLPPLQAPNWRPLAWFLANAAIGWFTTIQRWLVVWSTPANLTATLAAWLRDWSDFLAQTVSMLWPSRITLPTLDWPPAVGLAVVAGLGLAWLFTNLLLLNRHSVRRIF